MAVNNSFIEKPKAKKVYIEYIRAFATIAVVFLHIVMTLPANYTIKQLGVFNSSVFNGLYMFTKWAVPCFVMVSGALLLDKQKKISLSKIWTYIKRMAVVLLIFGTGFALMELVFSEKKFDILFVFKAVLNVAEEKSWSHLWYIYVLISLYIITIPLKYAIERISNRELNVLVCALVIGNFVIPCINAIAGTEIKEFMIITEYATYYIVGYWLSTKEITIGKRVPLFALLSTLIMITTETWYIYNKGTVFELNHQSKDILTLIQASCVYLMIKHIYANKLYSKSIKVICDCSFAIYLIHPFWINIFYKVLKITPLSMPIWLGIPVLFVIVLILSILSAIILKKIPWIKNII